MFFCAGRLTLEPDVGLKFFKKGKCSELNFRKFWPGSRHLKPCPDRPDPISSLTEVLSTHPINRFLSNPHSLLNRARRAQRKFLAWFQTPQTVSRLSRPNFQPHRTVEHTSQKSVSLQPPFTLKLRPKGAKTTAGLVPATSDRFQTVQTQLGFQPELLMSQTIFNSMPLSIPG